jgi:type II secretory pathway pseudopilin PulG
MMSESGEPDQVRAGQTPRQKKGIGIWLKTGLVVVIFAVLIALLLPSLRTGRETARRAKCLDNLKQIGLALHQYESKYGALPPAYTVDAAGKRLHSWRTLILPYLKHSALHQSIELSKPWDDPVNKAARIAEVSVYRCPSGADPKSNTRYQVIVAPNGCFRGSEPRAFSEFTDERSETLMIIEVPAERSVHWMSPQDADETLLLGLDENSHTAHTGGIPAVLCDGTARLLPFNMSAFVRRAIITIAGNEFPRGQY